MFICLCMFIYPVGGGVKIPLRIELRGQREKCKGWIPPLKKFYNSSYPRRTFLSF